VSDYLKPIVEALIFASPDPVTPKTLYKLLEGEPREDVDAAIAAVRSDYDRPGGLQLVEVAGGFQIVTRPELHEWVRKLFHERTTQKLSVQSLETLAVIAYKQPISRGSIASIRAVNVDSVVRTLLGRGLISEAYTDSETGAIHYETTELLLTQLGINSLDELPHISPLLADGSDGFEELGSL
jgi:segregation and condensation protein B